MKKINEILKKIEAATETLSHVYDDPKPSYRVKMTDSYGTRDKIINREEYLKLLMDDAVHVLVDACEELEEYKGRKEQIKLV